MFDLKTKEWDELREDFEAAAEDVVRGMQNDKATEAEIAVKVKISLVGADMVEDPTTEGGEAVPAYDAEIVYEVRGSVKNRRRRSRAGSGRRALPGARSSSGRTASDSTTADRWR